MDNSNIDNLLEKAVAEKVKREMLMVSRAFNTVIKNYAFLFNGEMLETQKALIQTCFPLNENVFQENNETAYFNVDVFLSAIPIERKEEIYNRILNEFVSTIDVKTLNREGV